MCGLVAICPQCRAQVDVPATPPPEERKPHLLRDRAINGARLCPLCHSTLPEHATRCERCGHDLTPAPPQASRPSAWVIVAILLATALALLALGLLAFGLLRSRSNVSTPPVQEAPVDTQETAADEVAALPEPTPAEETDAEAVRQRELEEQKNRMRATLGKQLDQNRPPYTIGETVALRREDGMMLRGVVLEIAADRIVVSNALGQTQTVAIDQLDANTRLRCDPAFRQRFLDYSTEQRVRGP